MNQPRTKLGYPEINLGILPGYGGTGRTVRRAGMAASLEMVLSGALISAEQALSMQLIDRLVEDENSLAAAMREEISIPRIADHTEDAESVEAALAAAQAKYCDSAIEANTPPLSDHRSFSARGWGLAKAGTN